MSMNDPLGDMLTRIRNAQMRGKSTVMTPASTLRASVLADPAVYPDEATIKLLWAPKPFNEEQDREMTKAWQAIKSG